jgi:hypothetical protein
VKPDPRAEILGYNCVISKKIFKIDPTVKSISQEDIMERILN